MKKYDVLDIEEIAERWDGRSSSWDKIIQEPTSEYNIDNCYNKFLMCLHSVCGQFITNNMPVKILDIGCGTGALIQETLKYISFAIGIDISERMIDAAKNKIKSDKVELKVMNCFEIDKINIGRKFSLITSRGIIFSHYSLAKAKVLLNKISCLLDPGGVAILDLLNKNVSHKFYMPNKTYYYYDEICQIASENNFKCLLYNSITDRVLIVILKKS